MNTQTQDTTTMSDPATPTTPAADKWLEHDRAVLREIAIQVLDESLERFYRENPELDKQEQITKVSAP